MSATTKIRGEQFTKRKVVKYLDGEYGLDGVHSASVLFAVAVGTAASTLLANIPKVGPQGETHPLYGASWRAFRYRWRHHERVSSKLVFLQVDYLSLVNDEQSGEEEADSIAGEEPITSHPWFLKKDSGAGIAGTFPNNRTIDPATKRWETSNVPAFGAIFDTEGTLQPGAADYNPDVGKFLYFAPGFQLAGQTAAGLERYKVPRGTYTRSYVVGTRPSLAGVGSIVAAPTNAPVLASGWSWLLVRKGYRRLGFIYRVGEGYEAGKWLSALYPPLPT